MAQAAELGGPGTEEDLARFLPWITQFNKAKFLSEEESKNDPETEPYKSKYEARKILADLKFNINKEYEENSMQKELLLRLAYIYYELGVNYADTEESTEGEDCFMKCVTKLEEHKLNPRCINLVINALNQLGLLWSGRRQPTKALKFLQDAECLYIDYKRDIGNAPRPMDEIFKAKAEMLSDKLRKNGFENNHTHTLYYLAQVYGSLGEKKKSAEYCQTTLKRQLQTKQYDPLEWALNCATLSQYYVAGDDYPPASHCLASASVVLEEGRPKTPFNKNPNNEADQNDWDKYLHNKADIARCWTKYALALLQYSKDDAVMEKREINKMRRQKIANKYNGTDDGTAAAAAATDTGATAAGTTTAAATDVGAAAAAATDAGATAAGATAAGATDAAATDAGAAAAAAPPSPSNDNAVPNARGANNDGEDTSGNEEAAGKPSIRFNSLMIVEEPVLDRKVTKYEEARQLFLMGQKYIKEAKDYYMMDGYVSSHVEIVQDHSQLFLALAFFDEDKERQAKMHKRRVDMLVSVLNELNPQHYLMICRQLIFELAETFHEMMEVKLYLAENSDRYPTPHTVKKINSLAMKSIKYFQDFVDTVRTPSGKMPEKFEEDVLRPVLLSYFYTGRLWSKVIVNTKTMAVKMEHLNHSLKSFGFIVQYCKKYPEAKTTIQAELDLCEEMVGLIPVRMESVQAHMNK